MAEKFQKVLVVDDERFNINVLVDLLKPSYKMMAAKSGQQALKAAHSANPPDLILLDIMMPEMDGYEVCRQLKADENTRDIPIIFVTAMGDTSDETKGLDLGAVDYLTILQQLPENTLRLIEKIDKGQLDVKIDKNWRYH